jgi:formylglycine-generating enzyme required for sulfatase activity
MRRAILLLLSLTLAVLAWMPFASAEKRVALVIGNGAYANATQLPNPRNDAEDVAAALKRAGFEAIVGLDLDQAKMQETAIEFARAAREADVALFYYSGHAMQFGGVNYLMPVDAKLSDEADLRRMARVDDILADLRGAKNLRILVLDACRDNPLAEDLKRSIGLTRAAGLQRGLARIDTPQGMIVAFSTQAQHTAEDGSGRNSPYTTAFLKHIEQPGEIGLLFRRISTDVYEATGHQQLPELSLSMIGEYYLRGEAAAPSPTPAPVATAPAPSPSPAASPPPAPAQPSTQVAVAVPPEPVTPLQPVEPAVVTVPSPQVTPEHKPGETFKDCENCPEMVVVPAGEFTMGSPPSEKDRESEEGPQHDVSIPAPFAVGKFELTKDQFDAFVNDSGYGAGSKCWTYENGKFLERTGRSFRNPGFKQGGNEPVTCINWDDAKAYSAWLSKKTGKSYRLPSEAEWEYAARAGSQLRLVSAKSEGDLCHYGNGADLTAKKTFKDWPGANCSDSYVYTAPVGSFAANDFGLHDMQGNVFEWVEDCHHDSYNGAPSDGSAWVSGGDCSKRVLRGGSWDGYPRYLRPAFRFRNRAVNRYITFGFRLARTL